MKTQISNLRSGTKNQLLNTQINYKLLPNATSHIGHSGSNQNEVEHVWESVISENPETMRVSIKGVEIDLTANWSLSRKSVSYNGVITNDVLEEKFFLSKTKKQIPTISIQYGNIVIVSNGKNSYVHICPSLIEIL